MVADDGGVFVMDFGLARPDGVKSGEEHATTGPHTPVLPADLTAVGSVVGTPAYIAPEQHLGLGGDVRSDQFAFCVALWEFLGARPFEGETSLRSRPR